VQWECKRFVVGLIGKRSGGFLGCSLRDMQSYTRAATLSRIYVPVAKCSEVSIYSASVGAHT